MEIKRFRHVAVIVKNMDPMKDFYCGIFGCSVKRDFTIESSEFQKGIGIPGASARCVHLSIPGSTVEIELFQFFSPPHAKSDLPEINDTGLRHIALVVDDIYSAVAEIRAKGGVVHADPVRFERPEMLNGFRFVYVKDPEGNIIELNQLPENA
jgi:glyoxylase I family protein